VNVQKLKQTHFQFCRYVTPSTGRSENHNVFISVETHKDLKCAQTEKDFSEELKQFWAHAIPDITNDGVLVLPDRNVDHTKVLAVCFLVAFKIEQAVSIPHLGCSRWTAWNLRRLAVFD